MFSRVGKERVAQESRVFLSNWSLRVRSDRVDRTIEQNTRSATSACYSRRRVTRLFLGRFISKSKSPRSQRKRRGSGGFSRIPHRRRRGRQRLRNCDLQLAKRAIVKSCRGVVDPATGTPMDERRLTSRCISKIDFRLVSLTAAGFLLGQFCAEPTTSWLLQMAARSFTVQQNIGGTRQSCVYIRFKCAPRSGDRYSLYVLRYKKKKKKTRSVETTRIELSELNFGVVHTINQPSL